MSTGPAPAPELVVVNGRMRGAGFDIPPGRSEIGRQSGVSILLDDQDVSRRHAVLERTGSRVVLTDPGSTNGTRVNGRRLRAGLRLTEAERSSAERDLQAVEQAVTRPDPDTTTASHHLQSFTANLKEAGALATTGVALAESIAKIAHWLGPLGAGVLALL